MPHVSHRGNRENVASVFDTFHVNFAAHSKGNAGFRRQAFRRDIIFRIGSEYCGNFFCLFIIDIVLLCFFFFQTGNARGVKRNLGTKHQLTIPLLPLRG